MVNAVYSDRGKQTLGENIESFINDRSAWPPSLRNYFEGTPPAERKRGLTISMLLKWMAEETGLRQLADPYYHDSFITLLGRYKTWGYDPSKSAGDNFILLTAIAQCGIVRDPEGATINEPGQLIDILTGYTGDAKR